MEYEYKKYFVIFNEIKQGYWDRIAKKFRGILFATQYEGNSIDQIYMIIENDPDMKTGHYTVKRIVQKFKKSKDETI